VELSAIIDKATKVGLILSPKYYVIRYYPYKQNKLELKNAMSGIIER